MSIEIKDLGLRSYKEVLNLQEELIEKRSACEISDTIIICSHPPVVTLGRAAKDEDLVGWKGQTFKINRGGRATYHGPSQVVCYPILCLKDENQNNLPFKTKDVRAYLEFLEKLILETLRHLKIEAKVTSLKPLEPGQLNRGVWVGEKKIASIGVAIKKWCTMHGFALNVLQDQQAFEGIMGCGFSKKIYTSINEFLETQKDQALAPTPDSTPILNLNLDLNLKIKPQSYESVSKIITSVLKSKFN